MTEPDNTKPDEPKASTLQSLGELVGMIKEVIRVMKERWARFAEVNMELAEDQLKRDNLSDAVLRYRFVLWKQPGNADAWSGLGVALLQQGRRDKGVAALKKALDLAPDNARAREALSKLSTTA